MICKIVNTHVALGVGFSYGLLTVVLREFMELLFSKERSVGYLFDSLQFGLYTMIVVGMVCVSVVAIVFVRVFALLRHRIEDEETESIIFKHHWLHALYLIVVFSAVGGVFYIMITLATFKAAIAVLTLNTFEYEVAPKPSFA